MPTWSEISQEIDRAKDEKACDVIRKSYLKKLEDHTGRPVIGFYSGWLTKRDPEGRVNPECAITDLDMNGFMAVVHGIDRTRGLDIVLHTPGGGIEPTRALVEYLYKMFGRDIRAIVPHMAMSAGAMMACAVREIIMGKHSCLGPCDPQIRGLPAMGVIEEVKRAIEEIRLDPLKQLLWQQVFSKYPPAFINDCERSVVGARKMVKSWLKDNMFAEHYDPDASAEATIASLMNYQDTTEHSHHYLIDDCAAMGLNVVALEADQELQEAVLSVHHTYMLTFDKTPAIKIIENASMPGWIIEG